MEHQHEPCWGLSSGFQFGRDLRHMFLGIAHRASSFSDGMGYRHRRGPIGHLSDKPAARPERAGAVAPLPGAITGLALIEDLAMMDPLPSGPGGGLSRAKSRTPLGNIWDLKSPLKLLLRL